MSIPGKLLYRLWHWPISQLKDSARQGGPWAQIKHRRAQGQMKAAALSLKCPSDARCEKQAIRVHLLTGNKFAYQTAFCLHTLRTRAGREIIPELYDDGSLEGASLEMLLNLFPSAINHPQAELIEKLDEALPIARFPVLRERWKNYPHIRKLIDVHLQQDGWRLVLDSDLLFWRCPELIINWSQNPSLPIHTIDSEENYGYPRDTLQQLAGVPIPPKVNVGLIGLNSSAIDWDFLEHASALLIKNHGTNYYLEQALCALLVARSPEGAISAPAQDYITYPSHQEIKYPTAVMHHYVDLSRNEYHLQAWRTALRQEI